jgi:hypothetical protein
LFQRGANLVHALLDLFGIEHKWCCDVTTANARVSDPAGRTETKQ